MQPHKIPTIFGLLLIAAVVGSVIFLFENISRGSSSARTSGAPQSVTMSNITDSSFTITWETADGATGLAEVKDAKGKTMTFYDGRDETAGLGKKSLHPYLTHSITATNLSANTRYEVKLLSDGKVYGENKTTQIVITGPALTSVPDAYEPSYGTIITAANQPAEGALVFVTLEGGQLLSTLTNASGSWIIPLNNVRIPDLSQYIPKTERRSELVRAALGGIDANAVTDTLNDSPLPVMTIGKSYDFRKLQAKLPEVLSQAPGTDKPAVMGAATEIKNEVALIQPAEGATLTSNLPIVSGSGIPGKLVSVVLGITSPEGGSATVKADGTWNYTPRQPLGEGNQSVTITSTDKKNQPVAVTHTFTVFKSGTQVLGIATPSATLEPTPTATPTAQPIPVSGTTLPTVLLFSMGIVILLGGILIAF